VTRHAAGRRNMRMHILAVARFAFSRLTHPASPCSRNKIRRLILRGKASSPVSRPLLCGKRQGGPNWRVLFACLPGSEVFRQAQTDSWESPRASGARGAGSLARCRYPRTPSPSCPRRSTT